MIEHTFTAESGWTIRDMVNSRYVAILSFREFAHVQGVGNQLKTTECRAFESESHSEVINAALDAAKSDARLTSFVVYETRIIPEGLPHAGKRDNCRID